MMDVLPALEGLFLEELSEELSEELEPIQPSRLIQEAFDRFVAARQLFGHPVAVSHWDGK